MVTAASPGVKTSRADGRATRNANRPAESQTLRANEPRPTREAAARTIVSPMSATSSHTECTRLAVTAKSTSVSSLTRGSSRCSKPGRAAISSFSSTSVTAWATESAVLRASERPPPPRRRTAGAMSAWQHGQGALTQRDRGRSGDGESARRRRARQAPTPHVTPTTSAVPTTAAMR